ncbi:MAG TPA: BadF/BadG/BcrA/BcrD ATPase family protein [Dehalococcoidia bacterium]|nr:BadF/BadG/BcrA/BcrD ATPase family protein [Dehalococcoidia bacterium]
MRLLALDGGGSKTVCLIADQSGRVLGWGRGGPSNLSFASAEAAGAAIREAIVAACARAGLSSDGEPAIDVAVCGGPVRPPFMAETVAQAVQPPCYRFAAEAESCLASGGANWGALVLAGTGSFEYARAKEGHEHRCDGWGSLFGDEGSAYDIARRALVAVARAEDGRGPPTALREAVLARFGVESFRAVSRRIYGENLPRDAIAGLSPLVSQAANADAVAREILHEAAMALAHGALTCIRAVGLQEQRFPLVLCGGAFRAGQPMIAPLVEAVRSQAPGAEPVRPRFEPVYGALRLAFGCATLDWDEAAERRFAESLNDPALEALVVAG